MDPLAAVVSKSRHPEKEKKTKKKHYFGIIVNCLIEGIQIINHILNLYLS